MFRWLGSLKIAVPLLIAVAAVLAWGTFYEARFGTAAAQRFIYHSAGFQLLLAFLGVNLAVAAFDRYPWKRRHIPFVLAHLGIILVLTGAVAGAHWGVEGRLVIPEGETSAILQTGQKILVVHQPNPGLHETVPVHFEATAWNHAPNRTFRVAGGEGPVQITVDRYYPDAVVEETVHPDGRTTNPAIRLRLEHEGQAREIWLLSRDPTRFAAQWGSLHALFLEVRDRREFLRLPIRGLPANTLLIIRAQSDGRLFGLLTGEKNRIQRIGGVEVGKVQPHPWLPLQWSAAEFILRARLEKDFSPRGAEVRREALHVVARQADEVQQSWLTIGRPVTLPFARHPTVLEYREEQRELPFSVKLLDFRRTDYPGTEIASAYESDVEVVDPARGAPLRRTIRMNHPLKIRGFSLFQSSYIPGPVEATVLAARKDPGTPLVYLGCFIIVAGIVTLFIFRGPRP